MQANMQNKQRVAANRMVEVKRANRIYVSPIVKTVLMKTWLRNSWVLPEAEDPGQSCAQAIVRNGSTKGSARLEQIARKPFSIADRNAGPMAVAISPNESACQTDTVLTSSETFSMISNDITTRKMAGCGISN
jgi:hypothetical protein